MINPAVNVAGVDICGSNKLLLSMSNISVELAENPSWLAPIEYMPVLLSLIKEKVGAPAVPLIPRNVEVVDWLITYKKLPSLNTKATPPSAKPIGVCKLPDTWNVTEYDGWPVLLTNTYNCVVAGNTTSNCCVRVPDSATYV